MYSRDKRSPKPKNEQVSILMSSIRAKNTTPEIEIRHGLWHSGIRGYRIGYKKVPGRPDIAFVNKKIAIFVNGCFWHNCPRCNLKLPRNNTEFWKKKFEANTERDQRKIEQLQGLGWTVVVVWECDIKSNLLNVIKEIEKEVQRKDEYK